MRDFAILSLLLALSCAFAGWHIYRLDGHQLQPDVRLAGLLAAASAAGAFTAMALNLLI